MSRALLERLLCEWSPRRHIKKWVQRARRGYSTEDTLTSTATSPR